MLVFRAILLFLIIFNFHLPIVVYSSFLSVLLAGGYYVISGQKLPFYYFFYKHVFIILSALLALSFISYLISSAYITLDYDVTKVFLLQLTMMICLVFVLPAIIGENESNAFENALSVVCYAFAIQGFIQISCLIYQPLARFMLSLQNEDIISRLEISNSYFRGYSLTGSPFFELPAGFGVAFICFFRLILDKYRPYFKGFSTYIVFLLLLVGASFSGRTAFTGLAFGVVLYILCSLSIANTFRSVITLISFSIFLCLIYFLILTPSLRKTIDENVLPFAFEFLYRYGEAGNLGTESSDYLIENFYYMPDTDTVIFGTGHYTNKDGTYYGHTDAGYMRSLLFGGIFYSLALLIYQLLFFISPLSDARSRGKSGKEDYLFLLSLLLHILVVNYKGEALGRMNIMQVLMLFITTSYVIRSFRSFSSTETYLKKEEVTI